MILTTDDKRGGDALLSAVAAVLLIAGLGLSAAAILLDPWDHDGGYFLLRSADVASGLRPHIDYRTVYPGAMETLMAPIVATGISRVALAIAIPMGWIVANTCATALMASRLTGSTPVALLIASLFPLFAVHNGGEHLTLEHGVVLFSMLALIPICDPRWALTTRRLAVFGFMFALAVAMKHNGLVTALPAGAILWTRRSELSFRRWMGAAAGFAAVPLAFLIWLGFRLTEIFHSLVPSLAPYARSSPGLRVSLAENLASVVISQVRVSPASFILFLLAFAGALLLALRRTSAGLVGALAFAGALIQLAPRLLRNYSHYNINLWPFLVLILCLALASLDSKRLMLALVAATGLLFLFQSQLFIRRGSTLMHALVPAAALIERHTPPGGAVRQYGAEPIIEFLASRREEVLDKKLSIQSVWDGGGMYDTPPDPSTTVLVVDRRQAWVEPQLAELRALGFVEITTFSGYRTRFVVLRHESEVARESAAPALRGRARQ